MLPTVKTVGSFLRSVSLTKALAGIWTRSLGSRWRLTAPLECRASVSLCCTSCGAVSDTRLEIGIVLLLESSTRLSYQHAETSSLLLYAWSTQRLKYISLVVFLFHKTLIITNKISWLNSRKLKMEGHYVTKSDCGVSCIEVNGRRTPKPYTSTSYDSFNQHVVHPSNLRWKGSRWRRDCSLISGNQSALPRLITILSALSIIWRKQISG